MTINTMKLFWNGIKINNEKSLVNLTVQKCDDGYHIGYNWKWATDFFEALKEVVEYKFIAPEFWGDRSDHVLIVKETSPIYNAMVYIDIANKLHRAKANITYYAHHLPAMKIRFDEAVKAVEEYTAELKKYPKSVTAATIAETKLYIQRIHDEERRQAEEEEQREEEQRQAEFEELKNESAFIEKTLFRFPVLDGQPYVKIRWSEHPAFYNWEDGELKLSIKAADIVFAALDHKFEFRCYFKTSFEIYENDTAVYEGRYDIGDCEGGLLKHIVNFTEQLYNYPQFQGDNFAAEQKGRLELLQRLVTSHKNQMEIRLSPEFEAFLKRYRGE